MKTNTLVYILLFTLATFTSQAQTLVHIDSSMVTTSGSMPANPMQFFDGDNSTPNANVDLGYTFQTGLGLNDNSCGWQWYPNHTCITGNGPINTNYYKNCFGYAAVNLSRYKTFASSIGKLNKGSMLTLDLKSTKYIDVIYLKNILRFIPNSSISYNFNNTGNYIISISASQTSLGPWNEINRDTIMNGNTLSIDSISIILKKASRYWNIQILDVQSTTLNFSSLIDSTYIIPSTISYGDGASKVYCTSSSSKSYYSSQTINGVGNLDGSFNIGEIQFYELPLLITSGTTNLNDSGCVTLTAATTGAAYQWNTGDITRSITVCNSGTYSVVATDTSFTGNSDYSATIEVNRTSTIFDSLPSPNGEIYAINKQGNNLFVAGDFTAFATPTGNAAMVDSGSGMANLKLPRIIGTINTIVPDGMGGWYIGGNFSKVSNTTIHNLAHINANYSIDMNFMPEPDSAVNTIVLNGIYMYVGGKFTTIKGYSYPNLAKIYSNTADPLFWSAYVNGEVKTIQLYADQIIVGGSFTSLGGLPRTNLGSVDSIYVQASTWNPAPNAIVYKTYISGAKLYVGGDFTNIGGVAKSRGAGFSLPTFSIDGYDFGANSTIYDMVKYNNVLYVVGNFTVIGGASRNYIAGLNTTNYLSGTFNPNSNASINAIALSGSKLIVGGSFTSIGGLSLNSVASLNPTTGIAFNWNPAIIGLGGTNTYVNSLSVNGSNIFIGGNLFGTGAVYRNYIAQLDLKTSKLTNWDAKVNGLVRAIYTDANYVYLGGDFTTVNSTIIKNHIVQLNLTTSVATGWNPNADSAVYALALKGNSLFVGGAFKNIGGAARSKLASINTLSGAAVAAFNPTANGNVYSLNIGGDTLYIGGDFTSIGGATRNRVAAYAITSSALLGIDPNANGTVNSVCYANNKLYVGGGFTTLSANSNTYFGEYDVKSGAVTSLSLTTNTLSGVNALYAVDSSIYQGGGYSLFNQ